MDTCSSGEDLLLKTRKPYTITKQREKWTEEEHNRFLEALKLYGRAWQRIEEHIGTKTAVQIRSHAQKFFSKLEKEALLKGVPLSQAHGIEIPPPRPKRKPSNPYPRKQTSLNSPPLVQNNFLDSIRGTHQKTVDLDRFDELSIDTQIRLAPPKTANDRVNGEANSGTTSEKLTCQSTLLTVGEPPPPFNISTAFSGLIISALMQNPTAHATATLAASLWPGANMEDTADATSAVAAATMAAASAWWATHGMLPFCHPAGVYNFAATGGEEGGGRSKSTSSESEENRASRPDPVEGKPGKKKADRSSCGSNTSSSSDVEVEPDAGLDKSEVGQTHPSSWKAVSHEGRKAFQALFSREVLPQSFSPPEEEGRGKQKKMTGFKPYKRCSVETKEGGRAGVASREERLKRIRLEGEGEAVSS